MSDTSDNTTRATDAGEEQGNWAGLQSTVARLRSDKGCPWDRQQTLASLKKHLVEETCELIDAMDGDTPEHHAEELGDVLLQIMLQSQIRYEQGLFSVNDVVQGLCQKLWRRHPHVFGAASAATPQEALQHWHRIKEQERTEKPTTSSSSTAIPTLPRCLPALQRAQKVQDKAAQAGFDWDSITGVFDKVREELEELIEAQTQSQERVCEEIGDLLFSVVNVCRFLDIDAEEALRAATSKFIRRFQGVEARAARQQMTVAACSPATLDRYWNEEKKTETMDISRQARDDRLGL